MNVSIFKGFMTPRAGIWVLEFALLALVCALAVLLVLRAITPVGPIGPLGANVKVRPSRAALIPAYDIFWPANRAIGPTNSGPWLLHGISFRAADPAAILSQGKGKEQRVFRAGDALSDTIELTAVHRDYVELTTNGSASRLYLDDAVALSMQKTSKTPDLKGILLPGPLDPALLAPYGLVPGDRVLSVNGMTLRSQSDLQRLVAIGQSGQPLNVTLQRGNETINKVIRQ